MAIAFHPNFEYAAVEVNGDVYIVAADLLAATAEKLRLGGADGNRAHSRARGSKARSSGIRSSSAIRVGILADHVTLDQGTGAVHTAPGHGQEDYVSRPAATASPTYCPVDAAGRFFHAEGAAGRLPEELIGKTVWEANPIVIEILKTQGALLGAAKRSSTATRTAGAATTPPSSAPPSSGSSAWTATICAQRALDAIHNGEVDAGVGRRAHLAT